MSETIVCAFCSSPNHKVLYRHQSGQVASCVCIECGLAYLSPRPTPHNDSTGDVSDVSFYTDYEQAYPASYLLAENNNFQVTARERATFVDSFLQSDASVVELGCGYGHFLVEMSARGYRASGFEPSAPQVAFARQQFSLDVANSTDKGLSLDGSADLIALFHVIEHVPQPLETLARCEASLAPGGILFMDLPNAMRLPATAIEHLYLASGQHLFSFTPKMMQACIERVGLSLVYLANHPLSAVYPSNLRVIAQKPLSSSTSPGQGHTDPHESLAAMVRYHDGLFALSERIQSQLDTWVVEERTVALYGGGFHTMGLMDLCDFSQVNLVVVVDDDESKWGHEVEGITVKGPAAIDELGVDAILVSSLAAEDRIYDKLANHRERGLSVATVYDCEPLPQEPLIVYTDMRK